MGTLYVTGGEQRNARTMTEGEMFWYKYHKGVVLEVDTVTGTVKTVAEYVSPPSVCAQEDPAILFKCGTLVGNKLYVGTPTEVLTYDLPDFTHSGYVSLPCFNDVHHVRPSRGGHLLVASSGLDMVLEVTTTGDIVRAWDTMGQEPWTRFSRDVDYRVVSTTKPHASHPNHIFYVGDDLWATRFEQRDAICLTDPSKRIDIGIERVHDGHVYDGMIYFTTVNGFVIIVDSVTLQVVERIDLNALGPDDSILGWCRGLLLENGRLWVGFSRLRLTKFRENVSWVRRGFRRQLPTRIACYDLASQRCLQEIELQRHGLDAVFSIFEAPAVASLDVEIAPMEQVAS